SVPPTPSPWPYPLPAVICLSHYFFLLQQLNRVPSPARFVELRPSPSNRRHPQILHLPLDLSIISLPRLSHYLAGD
ncbi:unnamed protein product, partial [Urochloa humidicola]